MVWFAEIDFMDKDTDQMYDNHFSDDCLFHLVTFTSCDGFDVTSNVMRCILYIEFEKKCTLMNLYVPAHATFLTCFPI